MFLYKLKIGQREVTCKTAYAEKELMEIRKKSNKPSEFHLATTGEEIRIPKGVSEIEFIAEDKFILSEIN
jgi:hypothetical protein